MPRGAAFERDFLQLDVAIVDDPLVASLAKVCRASVPGVTDRDVATALALGLLARLLVEAWRSKSRGRIGEWADDRIEDAVRWRGGEGDFAAWVRAELLEREGSAAGAIRGWAERYGALETRREQERDRKRGVSADSPGKERGLSAEKGTEKGSERSASSVSVSRTSMQKEPVLTTGEGVSNGNSGSGAAVIGSIGQAEPWVAEIAAAGLGEHEPDVFTLVASSQRPSAAWACIRTLLDPEASPHYPPATVGEAARSYLANEPVATGFRRRLFEGYLRGERKVSEKRDAVQRAANADAWRDRERDAAMQAEIEANAAAQLVAHFSEQHPGRFAEIEAAVERELSHVPSSFRASIRAGAIATRVRQEVARG